MRLKSKRLVSLLLAGSMMVSMVPASAVTAFAAETKSGVVAYAEDAKQDIPADGVCSVEVTTASAENVSGVQKALEAKYNISGNDDARFDNIKNLIVTTAAGITLDEEDFQFMSGVLKYSSDTDGAIHYAGADGTSYPSGSHYLFLRKLTTLDLSNAKCKDDTIPTKAFWHNATIEKVTLPETVKIIKVRAFSDMSALKCVGTSESDVVLPDSIETIGESAFNGDSLLTGTLHLPKNLQLLGSQCFMNSAVCGEIIIGKNVAIKPNIFSSASSAFFAGTKITSLTFESEKMGTVAERFAQDCGELKSVIITSPTIASIGKFAFSISGNTVVSKLESVTIPSTVTSIEDYAFSACNMLKTVNFDGNKVQWEALKSATNENGNWNFVNVQNAKYNCTLTYVDEVGTASKVETLKNGDTVKQPASSNKDGYKFDGWYNGETKVDFPLTITADTTLTANWISYETKADAEVKVNADPADKTVEIDVTVTVPADTTELDGATATLNFTDANGNDDSANVAEVAVDGKKLDSYKNISIADLMNGGNDAAMVATYAATQSKTSKLTVTYKTPGEHNVEIVLNAANGDVICKQTATVKITPEPGTLNLTACTAKLSDGTEVKNGDKVPVGTDVTVTFDKDFYADSNLVLNGWQVKPEDLTDVNDKLVKDITADSFTFVMPETENGVTIEAQTKTTDTEDDSWDAATVVAGVAVGAGAAVLTYHIGTELYAEQVLGKGVAVPKTRADVALKAWELAGKPAVAVEGEPLSEAAQAEKWAVESGLMQNVDGSFNGQKKMNKLKALRVLDSAKKMNAQ